MASQMISIDISQTNKALSAAVQQIPYAASLAINDLAFQVQRAENAAMKTVFAHPRPFTARSVLVNRSTKGSLIATVFVRPEVAKYLQPYETGGAHVLPGPALLKPVDITLDAYGQLPKATMARLSARKDIYIGPIQTKSGIISGVWQRLSITRKGNAKRKRLTGGGIYHATLGALKLLIRFGSAVDVKQHLDFVSRGRALVFAGAAGAFAKALTKALASAR